MSILSGILSGSGLILSALGAAIDGSHHPFKRALYRPGGPGGRADRETKTWECTKTRVPLKRYRGNEKKYSAQRCVNIKKPGRDKTVVINKAVHNAYGEKYRAGQPKVGPPKKRGKYASARDPVFRKDKVARGAQWKRRASKSK